ncbi:LOW QUALITY PROTEIN: stabilizer of axonemal microtubules 1 [Passerculus sandwichensis]
MVSPIFISFVIPKRDYIAHEELPQKPKPSEKHVKRHENTDLTSTYLLLHYVSSIFMFVLEDEETYPQDQDGYKNHLQRPAGILGRNRAMGIPIYKVNYVSFDGLTTHKFSYQGWAGQPTKLPKPYQKKTAPVPFSTTTEFQEKHKALQPPVFTRKPDIYLLPLEKMGIHTTTWTHWKHLNEKPAKMCRSLAQLNKITEPFNSSSTVKEDYKPWLNGLKPITHAPTFPAKPIDFLATFWTHQGPHSLTVTTYKPVWSGPKHHSLPDAKTTYTASSTPKGFARCLAPYKDPPSYIFEKTDADSLILFGKQTSYKPVAVFIFGELLK